MPKLGLTTLAFLLVPLLTFGCVGPSRSAEPGSGQPAAQAGPKRLIAAIQGSPPIVFQPPNLTDSPRGVSEVTPMLHASLTIFDTNGDMHPMLAESVPTTENGGWSVFPDGTMETTYRIREGVEWHDGVPLTTDDLLFTYRVVSDRAAMPAFRDPAFDAISRMEATDNRTIVVHWKQPFIRATEIWHGNPFIMPKRILDGQYDGQEGLLRHPYFAQEFVGLGPYKLKEWSTAVQYIFEANDRYILGRPKIDEIVVRTIADNNTIAASLLSGSTDIVLGRALSLDHIILLKERWPEGRTLTPLVSLMRNEPQFVNPDPVIVANRDFREAYYRLIDRDLLAESIQSGIVPAADHHVDPGEHDYQATLSSVVKYPYDPRRAAQLLEGLGYTRGPNGIYRDASGKELWVENRATSGDINPKTMFAVTDMVQQGGIGVDPVIIPEQMISDNEYRSNFPAMTTNGGGTIGIVERYHSAQARTAENKYAGSNRSRYSDPQLDVLIDRYKVTIPMAERMQYASEIVRIVTQNVVVMPLFWDTWPGVQTNRLQNASAASSGGAAAWNVHEWDIQ